MKRAAETISRFMFGGEREDHVCDFQNARLARFWLRIEISRRKLE